VQLTRPAMRTFADDVREELDGLGKTLYHLVYKRENQKLGRGTDFWAVRHNYISITLLDHRLSPVRRRPVGPEFCQALYSRFLGD
jgi:broad specificity polyphosphatase/5'/3'-nucleotidase SurE